ncbi:hypothetical protein ACIGHN_03455 [Acidovorax sp. NPDC077693]|uniref:hypothetical protein n=1 Tax=unclassified Acidovorax TaxID=2684926 RepID=UPI0037C984D2
MKLDPWSNAQILAQRLAQPEAKLVLVIGALAWCQKCREYLPIFEDEALHASPNQSYVWLDVEEHAAFLGLYIPHDLPLRLEYQAGQLSVSRVAGIDINSTDNNIPAEQIYKRLTADDWA